MLSKNLIIIFLSSTIASFAPVITVLLSGIIGSQLIDTGWASTSPNVFNDMWYFYFCANSF